MTTDPPTRRIRPKFYPRPETIRLAYTTAVAEVALLRCNLPEPSNRQNRLLIRELEYAEIRLGWIASLLGPRLAGDQ